MAASKSAAIIGLQYWFSHLNWLILSPTNHFIFMILLSLSLFVSITFSYCLSSNERVFIIIPGFYRKRIC
ncbi:hypothetical protein CW304_22745 [Bacillus sp. UFRGS-B20]|nr:hypothetical protein CW304_22745 [Bacillus sp. UFRGS-B20]